MSPNFRIRNKFGFLLTWPWSNHWVQKILGQEHAWESTSEAEAECWTHRYSTLALIEMQKMVDWTAKQDLKDLTIPLAMMYMINDGTIYPPAAISAFERWGSKIKQLIPVSIGPDAEEHVFVGDITAPHRVEWTVDQFSEFLKTTFNTPNPSDE